MGRAPCCDKNLVKKGPWAPEEDAMLRAYIHAHGTGGNWIALPQKIGLKRCGKSCRLRWLNYLRPNIKHGGFSDEEDNIICSLYISIGSRWSVIAAQLPGRTDNDIKNYWNTKLKKKLLGRRKQSDSMVSSSSSTAVDTRDGMSDATQRLSNSALERLQLHIQLQNGPLNGPTTLWPKLLHPAQERMIQNLNVDYTRRQQKLPLNEPAGMHDNGLPEMETAKSGNPKFDEFKISDDRVDSVMEQLVSSPSWQLQAEFDTFMRREDGNELPVWWSSDMENKSSASVSSNSWDGSNSVMGSMGGNLMMFHEYGLGYNM
uniref:Uncharacterized protein n=1 Tax=Kalanchoe fedtschenkoi TaxID=63787 RepID=A0A7N0ZUL1_KALFE